MSLAVVFVSTIVSFLFQSLGVASGFLPTFTVVHFLSIFFFTPWILALFAPIEV